MLKIFYGSNIFAKRLELSRLKSDYTKKYGEYSVRELSAEELEPSKFMGEILSSGLFSKQELIIVKRAEENVEIIKSLFAAQSSLGQKEIILSISSLDKRTLEYKEAQKHPGFKDFPDLAEAQLKSWIISASKQLNFSLSPEAVQDIILRTGLDQQEIWICLNQLALLGRDKLDKPNLGIFLPPSSSETAFNLLESALQKQPSRFQKSLKELELFKEDPYQIVALLCSQAHSLVGVTLGLESSISTQKIAKDLAIHPFVVSNQVKSIRNHVLKKDKSLAIAKIINWLDLSLKTINKTEPWVMIDSALMQISVL